MTPSRKWKEPGLVILALGRLMQEDDKFEDNLSYTASLGLHSKNLSKKKTNLRKGENIYKS
jgi:hypothetical protein